MNIVNESEFSVDEITKETIKCMRLSGKRLLFLILLVSVFVCLGIAGVIYSVIQKKNVSDFAVILGCFVILLLMLLYFKFMHPTSIRRSYVKEFGEVITFSYVFHINRVDCKTTSVNSTSKAVFKYEELKKVVEDKGILRLYIGKRNFIPVKMENFKDNEYEKIKKSFDNLNVKYITKK